MLDIKYIRENTDKVKKGTLDKQLDPTVVDKVIDLDEKRRVLIQEIEGLRATRNKAAHDKNIEKGKEVKEKLKELEPKLKEIDEQYLTAMYRIPNVPAEDVKVGKDDSENDVIRKWGEIPTFDFEIKDHVDIGEKLDIIDIKRATKVSGARFTYLKGDGVLLELALINFAQEVLAKEGFIPVIPPVMIKKDSMGAMGYLEHGGEDDMYIFDKDGLVLVGTSEQSIGPMHMDEVISGSKLPLRYMGFSTCFRREAGSYGKDTRGIIRVHQFDKVEMFSFTKPEDSDKEHEFLLGIEEKFFQALEIPYQVIKMCTGDIGVPFVRKYDIEAWMPGQGKYREVTSTSNGTDFQPRRLNTKFQDRGKIEYVHMLNGTAFAVGRTLVSILENYQQKDGSVKVPTVLQKWVGKEKIG